MFDSCAECLLGFAVVEDTGLVELCLARVPFQDKLFLEEDLVTDNDLHEGGGELNLLWMSLHEEEDDSLETVLNADLAILTNELQESLLVLLPVLDDITVRAEKSANKHPVAILSGET